MSDWAFWIIYIAGWLWYTRRFAIAMIANHQATFTFDADYFDFDRFMSLLVGAIAAVFWPITAAFYHARHLLIAALRTPADIQRAKEQESAAKDAELRKLRALAKQYNLPMGD